MTRIAKKVTLTKKQIDTLKQIVLSRTHRLDHIERASASSGKYVPLCRPRAGGDPSMWQDRCTASNGSPPARGRQL